MLRIISTLRDFLNEEQSNKNMREQTKKKLTIAFDIDDTLYKIRIDKRDQVPDYDLIQVLRWFHKNGDEVYVWSAGGIDFATNFVTRMGLDEIVTVIRKGSIKVDIAFDDMETKLATVDIRVNRDSSLEEEEIKDITTHESFTKEGL